MKSFSQLINQLSEAWPGTPEYEKKFGKSATSVSGAGSRHDIETKDGVTRATRRYDAGSGQSEEPTKSREDAAKAPEKRGRGRPAGAYGSYKAKIKESIEFMELLDESQIDAYLNTLDEETMDELEAALAEASDVEVKDPKTGKVKSWKHTGDWVKSKKKQEPEGRVANMSDVAQRKTAKMAAEGVEEEQIDEISTDAKHKYVAAAQKSVSDLGRQAQKAYFAGDKDAMLQKATKLKQRNDTAIRTMGKADIETRKKWDSDFGKNESTESVNESTAMDVYATFLTK